MFVSMFPILCEWLLGVQNIETRKHGLEGITYLPGIHGSEYLFDIHESQSSEDNTSSEDVENYKGEKPESKMDKHWQNVVLLDTAADSDITMSRRRSAPIY